jgi:hypothetical protein
VRCLPAEHDHAFDEQLAAGCLLLCQSAACHDEGALAQWSLALVRFADPLVGIREHCRFDRAGGVGMCEPRHLLAVAGVADAQVGDDAADAGQVDRPQRDLLPSSRIALFESRVAEFVIEPTAFGVVM